MRTIFAILILTAITYADEIKVGDRVELTLKNDNSFRGTVKEVSEDYITLDITFEYPSLNGTLSLKRSFISGVSLLGTIDPDTLKEVLAQKEKVKRLVDKQNSEIKQDKEQQIQQAEKASLDEAEAATEAAKKEDESKKQKSLAEQVDDLAKSLKIVEEFPPGDKWSEAEYKKLKDQFITIKVTLNKEEQRFVENFDIWKKGVEYSEKLKKATEQKPTEEKK